MVKYIYPTVMSFAWVAVENLRLLHAVAGKLISTFLRHNATVACRTNKPVYTARFGRTSHVFVASCKRALTLKQKT